jgi:hypothetical protein
VFAYRLRLRSNPHKQNHCENKRNLHYTAGTCSRALVGHSCCSRACTRHSVNISKYFCLAFTLTHLLPKSRFSIYLIAFIIASTNPIQYPTSYDQCLFLPHVLPLSAPLYCTELAQSSFTTFSAHNRTPITCNWVSVCIYYMDMMVMFVFCQL